MRRRFWPRSILLPAAHSGGCFKRSGQPLYAPDCKLEIFLPESHLPALQEALAQVNAGRIGNYDHCLSYSPVTGCWRPLPGAVPYTGATNAICTAPELKVEVTCHSSRLEETLAAIRRVHPYEEPVIHVIPLLSAGTAMQATPKENPLP